MSTAVEHSPDQSIFTILRSSRPVKILGRPDFGKFFKEPVDSIFCFILMTVDWATFSWEAT